MIKSTVIKLLLKKINKFLFMMKLMKKKLDVNLRAIPARIYMLKFNNRNKV